MNKSDSIKELAAAMSNAQATIEGALKDSANPFFKSKYADLESVWDAIRPTLAPNGLALIQFPISREGGVGVESILTHKSGEWMSNEFVLPMAKVDAQGGGSCVTYARRYAAAAIFGVCPEDDDGNAAANRKPEAAKKPASAEDTAGYQIAKAKFIKAAQQGYAHFCDVWKDAPEKDRKSCANDLELLKRTCSEADAKKEVVNGK